MNITILKDGNIAFPEIIKSINEAKKSIYINMFIWRDDAIGNDILLAVKNALERQVKVTIDKDLFGEVLEKSEENKQSMFHKKHTFFNILKAFIADISQDKPKPKGYKQNRNFILESIFRDKNLTLKTSKKKNDHSKFYLIDDEILIFGGINIEEKERSFDLEKMVYHDYMIKIEDKEIINLFKDRFYFNKEKTDGLYDFILNHNKTKEIRNNFFELIDNSKKELIITMAYLGDFKTIKKIKDAIDRGVSVSILTSQKANLQDQVNKKSLYYLLKDNQPNIKVYLSNKMIHTKMLIADDITTIGSANMNKTAYDKLVELNLYTKDIKIKEQLLKDREDEIKNAKLITNKEEIIYNKLRAFIESIAI